MPVVEISAAIINDLTNKLVVQTAYSTELRGKLDAQIKDNEKVKADLVSTQGALTRTQGDLVKTQSDLTTTKDELARTRDELTQATEDLVLAQSQLNELSVKVDDLAKSVTTKEPLPTE